MIVGNAAARRLIAHTADITGEQRGAGTVLVTAPPREPPLRNQPDLRFVAPFLAPWPSGETSEVTR